MTFINIYLSSSNQGRGDTAKFYAGRLHRVVQHFTLDRNGTPFIYHLLTNGTPSTYVPIVAALLTAENASSLKYQ